MHKLFLGGFIALFAALPATTTYQLNSYGFGSGGTAGSSTATYSLEGSSGDFSGSTGVSTTYNSKPGFIQTQQANVPKLTALDNNGNIYYNKLHFTIDTQNNPTDAKYLISVSTDNFATVTQYLQTDGTLSSSLILGEYQTYTNWGGSSGSLIIGLLPGTTYNARVRATQGKFSESAYGPISSVATASPTISFALQTSTGPSPPYTVSMGSLNAGVVNTSAQTINTTFTTNAASGGDVYIIGKNGGLLSASQSHLISATSSDLSLGGVTNGFGGQNSSVTQTSGGPYSVVSPYSGSGGNVGIINTLGRSLYTSSAPVTGGAGVLNLKAKAASTDVAATDYQEVLTFTAAANY